MPARKKRLIHRALLALAAFLCCLSALALLFAHYVPPCGADRLALPPLPAAMRAARRNERMPAAKPSGSINVNTADAEALCALNGVGSALARRIIEEREQNGRFAYVEDLLCVNGIGEKTFQRLLGQFCLD